MDAATQTPSISLPHIVWIGEVDDAAGRTAFESLTQSATVTRWEEAQGIAASGRWLPCDLIVVAAARWGQIEPSALAQARWTWPLAGVIELAGMWCEGEGRAGRGIPGALRVYQRDWPAFWMGQLAHWRQGESPVWSLPVAMGEEDRALERKLPQSIVPRSAAVCSAGPKLAALISDALLAAGLSPFQVSDVQKSLDAELIVWDIGQAGGDSSSQVRAARLANPTASIVLLADFPRSDFTRQWLDAGATVVLGKPFYLDELVTACAAAPSAAHTL